MTTVLATEVPDALRARRIFSTKSGLRTSQFARLSAPPTPREGLAAVQERLLLTAHEINRTHYMPYCAQCRQAITFDHNGLHTWVHDQDGADHLPEVTQHEDSYSEHPQGLSYVVWIDAEIVAWVLNDGTVTHVAGLTHARLRAIVRNALS